MNRNDDTPRDAAEILYGSDEGVRGQFDTSLSDNLHQLGDALGLTTAERDARMLDFAHVFRDAALTPDQGARLLGVLAHRMQTPASDEDVRAMEIRSRRQLREHFGADAEHRLDTARAFIKERPWLGKLLTASGAGSHEDWIVMLAENAHRLKITPRKKEGA